MCCLVQTRQKSGQKFVEMFQHFHCGRHFLTMAGMVRKPVFEKREIMVRDNGRKMFSAVLGVIDLISGCPSERPLSADKIWRNSFITLKILGGQQSKSGKLTRECCYRKPPSSGCCVIEKALRIRIGKYDRLPSFHELRENILFLDHLTRIIGGCGPKCLPNFLAR